jgi:hypothetical protein
VFVRVYRRGVAAAPRAVWPLRNDFAERVVWVLTSAVETLLALRLGLRLLDVSDIFPPVHLLYQVTDPLVGPFNLGIFHLGTHSAGTQLTFQLQPDSLLAMMVFWLLGWIITIFVGLATSGQEAGR